MDFRLSGISPEPFRHLFARDEAALATLGVKRYVADDAKGFPCRVSIEHAAIGEEVLLLSYQHQPADSPYRASGPFSFANRRWPHLTASMKYRHRFARACCPYAPMTQAT